jgi:hypothetical protein
MKKLDPTMAQQVAEAVGVFQQWRTGSIEEQSEIGDGRRNQRLPAAAAWD